MEVYMSTHHTIVLSTEQKLTAGTWNQLFKDAGGSMNLTWDDFEAIRKLEESTNKRDFSFGQMAKR